MYYAVSAFKIKGNSSFIKVAPGLYVSLVLGMKSVCVCSLSELDNYYCEQEKLV